MFRSITRGQLTVSFDSPDEAAAAAPRENVYAVGDLVNLPRRKQANVNENGGVAVVLSFRCAQVKGKHSVFYSVKHTVGGRVENDLSESLLEPYSYDTSKKRRSVDAEAKAKLVAEERELELLQRENARLRERVHNLKADATRTELQKVDLRAKYKETKRAASELAQKNEELNSKMSAQYQAMQKNVNDVLAEAKSQAQREAAEAKSQVQAEAALACSREREARIESMRQQQNKHAQEVKALKGAVQVATVARYQLESSVESMLKDTAKTVAEGYEGEVADLRAIIEQHVKEVDSLAGIAQALKAKAPSRLTPKTGTQSSSTGAVGRNERQAILQTLVNCFEKILDVAAINGDVDGLRKLLHESGKLSAIFGAPLEKEDAETSEIIENIVRVYQLYKRQTRQRQRECLLRQIAQGGIQQSKASVMSGSVRALSTMRP